MNSRRRRELPNHRVGLKLGVAYQGIHSQAAHAVEPALEELVCDSAHAPIMREQLLLHTLGGFFFENASVSKTPEL